MSMFNENMNSVGKRSLTNTSANKKSNAFVLNIADKGAIGGGGGRNTETPPGQSAHKHNNLTTLEKISDTSLSNWNGKANVSQLPTRLSQLTNDKGFVGASELAIYEKTADANSHKNNSGIHVTSAEKAKWNNFETLMANMTTEMARLTGEINTLKAKVEDLENGNVTPPAKEAPSFCGLGSGFIEVANVAFTDLEALITKVDVTVPQTVYAHSGATVYSKMVICAVPKSKMNITGVVDGAGISIVGAYPISEKTIDVPDIGPVEYVISTNKLAQTYNATTVVKFNLTNI